MDRLNVEAPDHPGGGEQSGLPSGKAEAATNPPQSLAELRAQRIPPVPGEDIEEFLDRFICPPSGNNPRGSRVRDHIWECPKDWVSKRGIYGRTINFDVRVRSESLLDPENSVLLLAMKQYLVALVFDPLRKPPKFGTLKGRAEGAFRLVAWAIANGKRQLASFTPVELAAATQDISKAWNKQGYALHKWQTILSEINAYGEMGLVSDWLRQVPLNALATDVEGKLEGLPPLPKKTVRDAQGHVHRSTKPLPDEFVTRLIRICLYYQNELAHHLFIHVDKFAALRQEDSISGKAKAMQRYKTFAQEYIDRRRWKDSQGAVMRTLPFEADYAFPPVGFKGLQDMVYAFQSTNQILIELATGMRLSEVSRLESDCVPKKSLKTNRPILRGRTYKLTVGYQGQKRTWPIPIEVAQAIANQVRLFQAFPADDGSEIWRSTGTTNFGASLNTVTVTHQLTRFPRLHKLDHLYEGGFNVRRFRPTLARHVVLAVTGAPRILQELFGHRNLTTTIDYILASPFIREEMQAAVDRQILGLKTSLVTQRQKAGGPGARLVRDAFDRYESEFEVPPDEKEQGRRMREYVETTLASGTGNLRMIMPGVICIRPIGAAGKCSKASEPPNAARCQTDCRFHVQMPERRDTVRASIEFLIKELKDKAVAYNELLAPWYAGQLRDHIEIFEDLKAEFMARRDVRLLLAEVVS